jgi:hypothetical protein
MSAAVTNEASSGRGRGEAAPLGDLEGDQLDLGGDAVGPGAIEGGGDVAADPGAVAVPVGGGRPAELGRQVVVGLAEQGLADRLVTLEDGQVDHLGDLGGQLGVGEVEAGVSHPDGHGRAAGRLPPALGQAHAAVVPEQALVVPGRVGVDPGRPGRGRRGRRRDPLGGAQPGG